jgi:hypothetical protein
MRTLKGKLDMTLLVYQTVNDWLDHVEAKHGGATADKCKHIVGTKNKQKMMYELKKRPDQILQLARSLL